MRLVLVLGLSAILYAQEWQKATDLAGIDFSGLSAAQKTTALKILRENGCGCGCDMKIAECRVKDPACSVSRNLAHSVIKDLKAGKSPAEVSANVAELAKKGPGPRQILDDPIPLDIAGAPAKGAANPKITIVEFSDFQCPYCAVAAGKMNSLLQQNPDIRLVFKQYPLDIHSQARLAAQASLAAAEQGKFWELHDRMFANFRRLNRDNIFLWAKEVGLDMTRFARDIEKPEYKKVIQKDVDEGSDAGVNGTPTFFINGKRYNGAIELDQLKPILAAERK